MRVWERGMTVDIARHAGVVGAPQTVVKTKTGYFHRRRHLLPLFGILCHHLPSGTGCIDS